jgi:hypothetical protein
MIVDTIGFESFTLRLMNALHRPPRKRPVRGSLSENGPERMKTVKLTTAAALVLILVGVAPQHELELNILQQSVAFLMPAGMASTEGTDSLIRGVNPELRREEDLTAGNNLLEQKCSICHSVAFVLKSGLLAGEVDSMLNVMQNKSRGLLGPREHEQISLYLTNRLPRQ